MLENKTDNSCTCQYSDIFSEDGVKRVCGRKLLEGHDKCFWHTETEDKYNQNVINAYFGQEIGIGKAIENEVKQGNCLNGSYLVNVELGGNSFKEGANLTKAKLMDANLKGSHLGYCSLRGADLRGANLESSYLSDADLRDVDFRFTNLHNTKFRNNDFDGVIGLTKDNFLGLKFGFIPTYHMLEKHPEYSVDAYRALKIYFNVKGMMDDASWAAYRENVMKLKLLFRDVNPLVIFVKHLIYAFLFRYQYSEKFGFIRGLIQWFRSLVQFCISFVLFLTIGYGERPLRPIFMSGLIILIYSLIYCSCNAISEMGFIASLYFSIVTFTTLGYGDIYPKPAFRLLASTEAILGILFIGLFLFTMGRRAVGRS